VSVDHGGFHSKGRTHMSGVTRCPRSSWEEQVIPFLHESAFRDFSLHGFRGVDGMQPVIMEKGRGDHPANAGIMGFLCFWRHTGECGCVVGTHFEYRYWRFNPGRLAALESHSIYLFMFTSSILI
jgi:hypothetical protein